MAAAFQIACPGDVPETLLAGMGEGFSVTAGPKCGGTLTYLDTHDWSLFRAGYIAEWVTFGDENRLRLVRLADSAVAQGRGPAEAPCGADKIAVPRLRAFLTTIIGARALLATASRRGTFVALEVRGEDDKLMLRAEVRGLDRFERERSARDVRVELLPVRGYGKVARLAGAVLLEQGAISCKGPYAYQLWSQSSRQPWREHGLHTLHLEPAQPALDALQAALRILVDTIRDNESGVIGAVDIEFLHDFRVAMRRIRSVLRDFKGVLVSEDLNAVLCRLGQMSRLGGEARDLDILLLALPSLTADLPGTTAKRLERHFEAKRRSARAALVDALQSPWYRHTLLALDRLASERATRLAGPLAKRPVAEVVAVSFAKLFDQILRDGSAVRADTPAKKVHRLRKRCKRLRYLLDVFGTVCPRSARKKMVRALRSIQDDLGVYQDCDVQQAHLDSMQAALVGIGDGAHDHETLSKLLAKTAKRQSKSLKRFRRRFKGFSRLDRAKLFERLFPNHLAGDGA